MQLASVNTELYEQYRHLLFSIAYRMLGSAMEAEDMVQEAFLHYENSHDKDIQSPKAYLTTIVTRLCLDQLKSAKTQREQYIGIWFPEPIFTQQAATSAHGCRNRSLPSKPPNRNRMKPKRCRWPS